MSVRKILRIIVGVVLIVFGLVALVLPLVPFAWVGLIGLGLLGMRVSFLDKIRVWFQERRKQK